MKDFLTNDAAILIINELDYDDTRQWCQTNQHLRQQCNLNYWLNLIRIDFDLTPEQLNDLMSYKPDNVTLAVYYKWLKMWLNEMSDKTFREAAGQGLLPIVKLYHYQDIDSQGYNYDSAFLFAAENGHLNVVQWFHSVGVDIHEDEDLAFLLAVENGHLEIVQWLYSLGDVDIHEYDDAFFRKAAAFGHLETAQWLYSLGGVDIHAIFDEAFREAAGRGYLDVAQWLYSLGDVDIHASDDANSDEAFREAAANGHLDVIQWLYSLGGVDIHAGNDEAFRWAARNGHLETAQWLYSLGGIDIHAFDHYSVLTRVRKWLDSLK